MKRHAVGLAFASILASCAPRPAPIALGPASASTSAKCQIYEAVDGDTIKLSCPDGRRETARLTGFDTPETYQASCAKERVLGLRAKARLEQLISQAQRIDTVEQGRDKYQRVLMALYVDRRHVANILTSEGLAVPYDGGRRIDWCQRLI